EDGIRDKLVTGVQTCALPILTTASIDTTSTATLNLGGSEGAWLAATAAAVHAPTMIDTLVGVMVRTGRICRIRSAGPLVASCRRSEERRVGKECRYRWATSP